MSDAENTSVSPHPRRLTPVMVSVVTSAAVVLWIAVTIALGVLTQSPATCTGCHSMRIYSESATQAHGSLECRACHRGPGGLAILGEGFGMQRWIAAEATGVTPRISAFDDSPCRDCHEEELLETRVRHGIRIRHVEFVDRPCLDCHGGTGHELERRLYGTALMEECTECHSAAPADPDTCDLCHDPGSQRGNEKPTTWRVTHGPNWKTTHGMGDLRTCVTCHEPERCASCHGVSLPHPPVWHRSHGKDLTAESRKACMTCHEEKWCVQCHGGMTMPHVDSYIMMHQVDAKSEPKTCTLCHVPESCDDCHRLAAHPQVDGVAGHEIEGASGVE